MIGQFAEKAGDYGKAAENYITAYGVFKDPSISKVLNGLAATLYNQQKFADAEKVFRQFYAADQGPESAALLGQTLYKQGKIDEALAIYKEGYAKKKTAVPGAEHRHHPEQGGQGQAGLDERDDQRPDRSRRSQSEGIQEPPRRGREPLRRPGQGARRELRQDRGAQQGHRGVHQDLSTPSSTARPRTSFPRPTSGCSRRSTATSKPRSRPSPRSRPARRAS